MSPKSRAVLAALLLFACGCLLASCAASRSPASVPETYESFCVTEKEAEAFTVVVVRVDVEGVLHESYRFPISRKVQALFPDSSGGYPVELCGGSIKGISADNPFNGSGYNGYGHLSDISAKGATFSMSFSWDKADGSHGSTKAEEHFAWDTPARRQIADGVVVTASFETPKRE
jgi:hypothetical protein